MSQELGEYDMRRLGRQEGRQEERYELLMELYQSGIISKEIVLEKLNITEEEFEQIIKDNEDCN